MIFSTAFASDVKAPDPGYRKEVLDNGATVISRYVAGSPLVSIQIRVLSGLSNEGEYAGTGISHYLEHLLFKGTSELSSEKIRKKIKAMGGIINGSTGLDSAEYHLTVPVGHFREALALLTDLVMEPVFTDAEMNIERDVILSEIRMQKDDPLSRRMRLLFTEAFRDHVYKYPVIGYNDLFIKLSREDVLDYHSLAYTPDKIVIGITGGVSSGRALSAAKSKLAGFKRGRGVIDKIKREPGQLDARNSVFYENVSLGYMAIGFHTTNLYSPDLYPGDVLSIILGGGNDSRLYKSLVKEKQLLYSVSSVNYTPRYPGLFVVTGVGDPEDLEAARREIFNVIHGLVDVPPSADELTRAKNIVISGHLRSYERINSMNSSMTDSQLLTGDPAFYERYVEKVREVTIENVAAIAPEYLREDNSTTVSLVPEGLEDVKDRAVAGSEAPEEDRSVTLKNGLRIIAKRKGHLPLVSVTLAVNAGLISETAEENGISNLTAPLILKGTKKRKEEEIIPVIESMGGSISSFSGFNSSGVNMRLIAGDLDKGLDIFADVAQNAIFPKDEISKHKKKVLAAIKEEKYDIFEEGFYYLRAALYGDHPYGKRVLGTEDTINSITRSDIQDFYKVHFQPGEAVITVVGDIDVDETVKNISERFRKWKKRGEPKEKNAALPFENIVKKDFIMKKEQALLVMGFPGVTIADDKKYTLDVISSFMSGSDGLLFYTLREKEGAAYTSAAISVPEVDVGFFLIYVATTNKDIDKSRKIIMDILRGIKAGKIAEEDIEASKNKMISQHALSLEGVSSVSLKMALDELYGLGSENYRSYTEKIKAVNKNEIITCAAEIFNTDNYAEVIIHSER